MKKIRNKHKGVFGVTECAWAIDEIIDWINARSCPKCGSLNLRDKGSFDKCMDCGERITGEPSIEQELESGLKERKSHSINCKLSQGDGFRCFCGADRSCTRIFLPAAKYMEYAGLDVQFFNQLDKTDCLFHDIPVFSYSGDEIIYCTD